MYLAELVDHHNIENWNLSNKHKTKYIEKNTYKGKQTKRERERDLSFAMCVFNQFSGSKGSMLPSLKRI